MRDGRCSGDSDGKKVKMNNQLAQETYTYIDLFAGCGGLSLGLMKAGWKGLFGIEKEANAFSTLKHNLIDYNDAIKFEWPEWLPVETHDITNLENDYSAQLEQLKGTVTMITGGPPCQGFSLRGKRDGNDTRNRLFEYYLRIVEKISPILVFLENVHGIAVPFSQNTGDRVSRGSEKNTKTIAEEIAEKLDGLNYKVFSSLVDSSLYGVPQSRSRYIMIGINKSVFNHENHTNTDDNPFSLLENLRKKFLSNKGLPKDEVITVQCALSDLERKHGEKNSIEFPRFNEGVYGLASTSFQKLMRVDRNGTVSLRETPDSHRFANHKESTVANFRKLMACKRGVQLSRDDRERLGIGNHDTIPLASDQPCHTLTTLPDDCIHYSEPRIFTVREYARIQSFPDWFELKGKYTTGGKQRINECPRYTQVGNAVPPLLGEALGLALIEFLEKINVKPYNQNNNHDLCLNNRSSRISV